MKRLFEPVRLGARTAPNRLVVAPMTTTQSHPDGSVSEAEAAWLERLARDGYGMVISCAASISRESIAFPNQLGLGDDAFLPGLRALADRLRPYPSLALVQLCHAGSRAIPELAGGPAYSASGYDLPGVPGFVPPLPLSKAHIARIVEDFARAAARAAEAGFDGIEMHGANGYLFTQFLSRMTNLRTDEYGGSLENRARFAREVVRACRKAVPEGFLVGMRLSFENAGLETGLDIDENIEVLKWLAEDGADYGHVSHLVLDAPSVRYPDEVALTHIRDGVGGALPLVAAGSVTSRAAADRALALGADFVAVGRAAIGNLDVPSRLARGEALTVPPFDPDALRRHGISEDFLRYVGTAPPLRPLGILARS